MTEKKQHLSNLISQELSASEIIAINKYYNDPSKEEKYKRIREACVNLMIEINDNCPICFDRTMAMKAVRDVRMLANSSIALDRSHEA